MAYIGRDLRTGAFRQLDDISSGFDGSDTTHTMQVNSTNVSVGDVNQILLSLGGVIQKPGTDFTVSGSTLTFTTAPAANTSFFAILLGSDNGGTVTPTDGSVTTDKIAADQITKAKLADEVDIFAGTSLSAADLGTGIHIKTADSSGDVSTSADNLVIEDSGDSGMTILGGTSNHSRINFGDSGDNDIGQITYDHGANAMNIKTNANGSIYIDSDGHVTMARQPAFLANPSTNQLNFATSSNVQVEFGSERFDQNGDFASHTFTAPVTGRYQLSASLRIQSLDTAADYYQLRLATSNQTYSPVIEPKFSSDPLYWTLTVSLLVDMDANDTANVNVRQQSGTQQADIDSESYFSGFLAC
jgi:hypothetical protein